MSAPATSSRWAPPGRFLAVCIAALTAGGPLLLAALVLVSSLFQLVLSQRLS